MQTERTVDLDGRFDAVDGRLDAVGGRLEAIDGRLVAIDQRFEAVNQRFEAVDRRFEETHRLIEANGRKIDDNSAQIRHTHVLVEDLRSDLKAIAEGVAAIHDKLDQKLDTIDSRCASDRNLDRKAHTTLRRRVDKVEGRIERLESA